MSANLVGGRAAPVDDPTDLTRDEYKQALKQTLGEIKDDDVPGLACGVAFKIFLALFPSLFAGVAIFSIVTTPSELSRMLGNASAFLPEEAIELLQTPLQNLARGGGGAAGFAAVSGIAAGLWAATSAAISLMKALSRAYDTAEERKFVKQRIVGLSLIVALVAALAAVILLLVVGPQIREALLPGLVPPFTWLLALGRFALALGVLVLLFAFVYWIGPDRDQPRWVWISPGAVLAVIGWLVAAGAFTLYAQTAGDYEATYGAIAGVIVLLLWLQLSMMVILVGAEFNAEIERRQAVREHVGEGAGFAVPAAAGAAGTVDREAAAAAVTQAAVGAHSADPDAADHEATAELAARQPRPTLTAPSDQAAQVRKAGALVAGIMAVAVFLGFARKRSRR